ncbi:MAG: aldose epimerase family protein [Promethearchaeota archaeon]
MNYKKLKWDIYKGKQTYKYIFEDEETGFYVELSNFGATLIRVKLKDKNSKLIDINFGHEHVQDYIDAGAYFGAVIGRFANRIANAKFSLEGKEYNLYINNAGLHSLHGGKEGFNKKLWDCEKVGDLSDSEGHGKFIRFKYVSPDGEEGYPGELTTIVTFYIYPMKIGWSFDAETNKTTILNLTQHSYWNLEGVEHLIDGQKIRVNADYYMPADENNLPTGEVLPVENTAYDLREGEFLKDIFEGLGDLDHNFMLNDYETGAKKLRFAAELESPNSGIKMVVKTTEPCLQVYTGNFMEGLDCFGKKAKKHSAICLEAQKPPNAINMPEYRDWVILKPGQRYFSKTQHIFDRL